MRPLARLAVIVGITGLSLTVVGPPAALGDSCGSLPAAVGCGASADVPDGYFHGVIGVAGQPWVLDLSSRSGSAPGCGDCTWTVLLDCPETLPTDTDSAPACAGLVAGNTCPEDLLPFRLYLTTRSVTDELVGTVCLGGSTQVVEVGADADADAQRYLRDVTPPDLLVATRPHGPTLTGLATYFSAALPAGSAQPVSFGGRDLSESITLVAERVMWQWGDGEASDWSPATTPQTHRYLAAGRFDGRLTTVWGATYTATFDGQTVGPYDASGTVSRTQPFVELVDTSRPVLVDGR